ncbi:hypothetical protein [Pseudorhodobacter sp.]|jgi:hypothetical protein|uniref:hypothetical protein n=1 Tax=Pseudorhodobacter sp. TaxID=1934400 RepID=UPI002AFF4884|nr:hypothetical protein [Pseudorhodobacter sp.]
MKCARIEPCQVELPCSGGVYQLSGGRAYRSFDALLRNGGVLLPAVPGIGTTFTHDTLGEAIAVRSH